MLLLTQLIDHDGTINHIPKPKRVIPSSVVDVSAIGLSRTASNPIPPNIPSPKVILQKLAADPVNIVYLVSTRQKADLHEFEEIKNLGLSAENGGFIKYSGSDLWEASDEIDLSWRVTVLQILEYYTEFGSFNSVERLVVLLNPNSSRLFGTMRMPILPLVLGLLCLT